MSNELTVISTETAKQKISIALTKVASNIQELQNEANSLVFNDDEESLKTIKAFLDKCKKSEKTVADEHTAIKKPYLEGGKACDQAKNDMLSLISGVSGPVHRKYAAICDEIDRKKREELRKQEQEKRIMDEVKSSVIVFSQQIAACTTKKQLADVERLINLEKSPSRAAKYGEYHPQAIEKFEEVLLPILKDQKVKVEQFELLQTKIAAVENPEEYDLLQQKLEEKSNEIVQNKIDVQESALKSAEVEKKEKVTVIIPTVKAKRTDIVCEVVDMEVAIKKNPELFTIELKTAEAKKVGAGLRDAGSFGDKDEVVINGIKYKIVKSW